MCRCVIWKKIAGASVYMLYRSSKYKNYPLKMEESPSMKNIPNYVVHVYCCHLTKCLSLHLHPHRNIKYLIIQLCLICGVACHRNAVFSGTAPQKYLAFPFSKLMYISISKCIQLPKSEALCILFLQSVSNVKSEDISEILPPMRNTLSPPSKSFISC